MASTYSSSLAIELIGTGEQSGTWGTTTNTNLGTLIEQAISGYVTQAITDGSGANTTITIPNGATGVARNMYIEMTGALTFSTTSLIVPANKKLYFIFNNTTGGFAVTVKVSGQTGVLVPNGKKVILTSNGTDIVEAANQVVGAFGVGGALTVTGAATVGTTLGVAGASLVVGSSTFNQSEWIATDTTIQAKSTNYGGFSLASSRADADGVRLGAITWDFLTNTATYRNRAYIEVQTNGSTANKRGGNLIFGAAADNATAPTAVATVASTGLSVTGTLGVTGDFSVNTNVVSLSASAGANAVKLSSAGFLTVGTATAAGNAHGFKSTAAGSQTLSIENANASTPFAAYMYYSAAAPNGTGNEFLICADTGATRATIRSNGGIANFSGNNVNLSDIRTKKDIQPAGAYLQKIMAIPVKTFLYNDQTDTDLNLGVIAQDVEAVAPELIDNSGFGKTPDDGIPLKAIYQTDLQYALMKALQELAADFQSYKSSHP